jgi:hypothetical protein
MAEVLQRLDKVLRQANLFAESYKRMQQMKWNMNK